MKFLHTRARSQRGSAMVEAAIVIPVLVLAVYWSAAMTDVMVLRVKAAEAARFALWETTVFRQQAEITADVAQRFRDLRSPASMDLQYTGLMLYPQAKNVVFGATVSTSRPVSLGGAINLNQPGAGILQRFLDTVLSFFTKSVDAALARQRFNTNGGADARVTLVRASHVGSRILMGGDLVGDRGGSDLDHPGFMQNFTFQAPVRGANPMRLVFDTWKAWPKPAAFQRAPGTPTNTATSPNATYKTVEEQVSGQVNQIVFLGMNRSGFMTSVENAVDTVANNGITKAIFGGRVPSLFSAKRMDDPARGPITIRPVDRPDASFVPTYAPGNGMQAGASRLGELASDSRPVYTSSPNTALISNQDPSRYTLPYKINSRYFTDHGGGDRDIFNVKLKSMQPKLAQQNEYVKTYNCRGHYFAGSRTAGEATPSKRYQPSCWR